MSNVLLLASPSLDDFWTEVLEPLFTDPRIVIVGACIDVRQSPSLLATFRQHIKKGRGGYVVVMALKRLVRPLKDRSLSTADYLRGRNVALFETDDLYSEATLDFILAKQPDCIFRFGFGFIREPILCSPRTPPSRTLQSGQPQQASAKAQSV